MNYSIHIDQINAAAWGLNMTEAGAFAYMYTVPTWADPVIIDGQTFYFVARQKMCQDIPLVVSKEDTAYRILKSLFKKGVIKYVKFGMKDCIQITALGKGWNSEKNPTIIDELGKKSESTRKIFRNSSEKNPTYPNTIYPITNLSENKVVENSFSTVTLIDEVDETMVEIHHVPEYFETEQETPTPQVAPPPRPKSKKEPTDDPTPTTAMFDAYKAAFARLNNGQEPEFHKKYLRPMKTLYAVLRDRAAKKGLVHLDNVQPWRDFLDLAVVYLKANPKETYLRGRFDPLGIEAEFNKWISVLSFRPQTDAEKWVEWMKKQGIA